MRWRRWYLPIGITVVVAVVAVILSTNVWRDGKSDHWYGYPHTMGCAVDRSETLADTVYADPPDRGQAKQVTVAHPAEELLVVSIEFRQPPDPRQLSYTIHVIGAPLSSGPFRGDDASIIIRSLPDGSAPERGPLPVDWDAHRTDEFAELNRGVVDGDESGPIRDARNLLTSVRLDGNTAHFELDMTGQSELLGDAPFRPTIRVFAMSPHLPPAGRPAVFSYQQYCHWDAPVTDLSFSETATTTPETRHPRAAPRPDTGGRDSPPVTEALPNPGVQQFSSPTGNIACNMSPTAVACEIREYAYPVPASPTNCAEYGDRFGMDHGGPGFMACHIGSLYGQPTFTLDYDSPLTAGPITCEINKDTGVTCRDTETGHFFRVSRQSYQTG